MAPIDIAIREEERGAKTLQDSIIMDDTLRTIPADKENTATRLTFDYENVKDSTGVDSKEHHVNQPYPLKVPPHVRRLGGVKVSSPSDNLSPCSQKLMATNLRHG